MCFFYFNFSLPPYTYSSYVIYDKSADKTSAINYAFAENARHIRSETETYNVLSTYLAVGTWYLKVEAPKLGTPGFRTAARHGPRRRHCGTTCTLNRTTQNFAGATVSFLVCTKKRGMTSSVATC